MTAATATRPLLRVPRRIALLALIALLVGACASTPPPAPAPLAPPTRPLTFNALNSLQVGWAYEAYPETSYEKMRSDMLEMRANGATAIWLGHNNPGIVDAAKVEPGLSYAVFAALQDITSPLNQDARAMAEAVKRALDAGREAKLKVVLPIGYQIQMGDAWNLAHPDDLRREFDSTPLDLYDSGYTASPYSPQYREDITRYYEWVQSEWVAPYADVLVMLSLADEPMGGDYSRAAKREFARRYGKQMDELDTAEQWRVGEFQSGVIADYAAWSAKEWQRINQKILTTMSFHGGETARRVWGLPDVEKLFAETPENFVVSFDAYLHDDIAEKPATTDEAAELKLFLTTIGYFSHVYQKPIALWGGVNAWGLAQESSSPLGIPDAVTNLILLHDLPARVGGTIWGIFAWNYNVKRQGLENYGRATTYDAGAMQIAVNHTFPVLRSRLPARSGPEIAIWVSRQELWDALAETHAAAMPPAWFDARQYARAFADRDAVIVTSGPALETLQDVQYLIVPRQSSNISTSDLDVLQKHVAQGQIVLVTPNVAHTLGLDAQVWEGGLTELPRTGGVAYIFDSP